MEGLTVTFAEDPSEEEKEFFNALQEYNEQQVGESGFERLMLFAQDGEGRIVGGLRGGTVWKWLHVTLLVVRDGCRNHGIGSRMMAEAEAEAKRRGCIGVHLETMSFQAVPFYRKRGYEVFGQIEDMPPGHTCYFLKKILGNGDD